MGGQAWVGQVGEPPDLPRLLWLRRAASPHFSPQERVSFVSLYLVELGHQLLLVARRRWAGLARIKSVGTSERKPKKRPDDLIWFCAGACFVNLQNPPTPLTS